MVLKGAALELDSYRLATYVNGIPCYVCGDSNAYDLELCRSCFAPMALAHQARAQGVEPGLVATIGSSGIGKTVYLGMLLDMLSRQPDQLHLLARGAFSITLQQLTAAALARCEFPAKTANEPDRWNWVHCQVNTTADRAPVELVMPDLAGEALLEEVDHPKSYRVIHSLLSRASGVMILVDSVRIQEGALDQDFFTMKLLSYLSEVTVDPTRSWADRPVAIVFTKADQCDECFDDPAEFAQRRTPGLWQYCQAKFHHHQFFAASVAGSTGVKVDPSGLLVTIPTRVEPRGIIEPFAWLVEGTQEHLAQARKSVRGGRSLWRK